MVGGSSRLEEQGQNLPNKDLKEEQGKQHSCMLKEGHRGPPDCSPNINITRIL